MAEVNDDRLRLLIERVERLEEEKKGIGDDIKGVYTEATAAPDLYPEARRLVTENNKASISWLQRQLRIGFNSAALLITRLEKDGVIGPANHVGRREVLGAAETAH